jgi:two-component system, chemotaxis family, chemotaxis protein CheY
MRLFIRQQPTGTIDGFSLEGFRPGREYEVGTQLAGVLVAEGWAEPVSSDDYAAEPDETISGSALVLVVDDDTDLRRFTVAVLSANGYDVVQAQHGREALARLAEQTPHLIVLDLNMPVMDGWQFCTERERSEDQQLAAIPVLLLTGADPSVDHRAATKAVALVQKPFEPDVLLAAIKVALTRGRNGDS